MIQAYENKTAKRISKPDLSVLIPYYNDDPSALLAALHTQYDHTHNVEILLYDDGTQDEDINTKLRQIADTVDQPTRLFFATTNTGRSAARNYLMGEARAPWVLFLDADMRPLHPDFLTRYLSEIKSGHSDIIFGGFRVADTADTPATELHRALSLQSDCLDAATREQSGPQYVCTSNLCVRKSVLDAEPFDITFKGWGWEDSEWAARAVTKYRLKHLENAALHMGLENTETLLARFRDSADNYVQFTKKHPDLAQSLTLFTLSQRLKKIPGQKTMRPILAFLVRNPLGVIPMKLRVFALKMWRASWYAGAL
ncbi:MAG TPA: glycosyltransferase family 2 protein [Hellea balneolensis]|uniref:Glycosyltransferase family 2 protein n=1 Tax=Hellea balneolensis TaxID=287478 RepID=A0A7C5LZF8_9PROT|nr:glycosyltransferase family 2 protein [Hellea balneolensis]